MEIIKEEVKFVEKTQPRFPWIILTILLTVIGVVLSIAISSIHFRC